MSACLYLCKTIEIGRELCLADFNLSKQVGQRERRQEIMWRFKGVLITVSELVMNSKLVKEERVFQGC